MTRELLGCDDLAIDRIGAAPYIFAMIRLRHLLFIAVLATYVVGLGVLSAGASAMAGNMVMGEAGEMEDCQGCDPAGGDDPAAACDIPCLTPMTATVAPEITVRAPGSAQASGSVNSRFVGRNGPPDPSPPRSILLS